MTNVKDFIFQRSVEIENLAALTKSLDFGHIEFILHVTNEYDYFIQCDKIDELFEKVKECYFKETQKNLPIYGVPGKVENYRTTKRDIQKGTDKRIPDQQYRLTAEDVFVEEEKKEILTKPSFL